MSVVCIIKLINADGQLQEITVCLQLASSFHKSHSYSLISCCISVVQVICYVSHTWNWTMWQAIKGINEGFQTEFWQSLIDQHLEFEWPSMNIEQLHQEKWLLISEYLHVTVLVAAVAIHQNKVPSCTYTSLHPDIMPRFV